MDSFRAQEPAEESFLSNSFLRCLSFIRFAVAVLHTALPEARRWLSHWASCLWGAGVLPSSSVMGRKQPQNMLGKTALVYTVCTTKNLGTPLQLLTRGRPQESSEGQSVNSEDFFFFKEKNLCCRTPVSPLLLTSSLIHSFICSTIQQYLLGASYEPGTGGESLTLLDFTVWGRGDRDESAT